MALQKQVQSLPFTKGIDAKSDPVMSSKPSRMENSVFRGGTVGKRFGTQQLAAAIDTGGNQTAGEALFALGSELVRINGGTTYGLGQAASEWVTRPGGGNYSTLTNKQIQRNARTQQGPDQVSVGGVAVFAWVESTDSAGTVAPGVHVAVMDESTGAFYQPGTARLTFSNLSATGPRCIGVGSRVLVIWGQTDSGNIQCASVDTTNPTATPSVTTIGSAGSLKMCLDGASLGATAAVAFSVDPGATGWNSSITLIQVSAAGSVLGTATFAAADAANDVFGLNIAKDTAGNVYLVYSNSQAGSEATYYIVRDGTTLASVLAKTAISASKKCTAALVESSTNHITAFLQNGTGAGAVIASAVLTSSAVTTAYANISFAFNLSLITDAFVYGGVAAVGVVGSPRGTTSSNVQPTGWVMDVSGNPIARILPGLCDYPTPPVKTCLGRAAQVSGSTVLLYPERGRLAYSSTLSGGVINTSAMGFTRVTLTPVQASSIPVNLVGQSVYLGGALPRTYDGQQVVESGIPLPMDGISVSIGAGGAGGGLSAGTYQWRGVYSWINSKGELVRGPPGPAVSGTAAAGAIATITYPFLSLSSKDKVAQSVQLDFYRTTANGSVFYKLPVATAPLNAGLAATSTVTDGSTSDAALQVGELLYTTGGILDWLAPPAYKFSCAHKSRLVIGGLEDPYEVRFSSMAVHGEALRFNEVFSIRVPSAAGPVSGLASLDDKLIIFTNSQAFFVYGDGPDNLGNNPFSQPQPITGADVGCAAWQSIVSFPGGVIFESPKGLVLLDRSLQARFFGADVEPYTVGSFTVRSAQLCSQYQQVRFLVDNGSDVGGVQQGTLVPSGQSMCLVYDYFYDAWSYFPGYGGQSACLYQGAYTRVRSDGVVFQETPGQFKDSGAYISSTIETDWIRLAGIQGFQRIWNALLLGLYGSDFTLTWAAAYDYSGVMLGSPPAPVYLPDDTLTFLGNGVFNPNGSFEIQRHLRIQKCAAVKFRFSDSALGGTGQGMGLSDLTLEFGIKPSAVKVPASRSF